MKICIWNSICLNRDKCRELTQIKGSGQTLPTTQKLQEHPISIAIQN